MKIVSLLALGMETLEKELAYRTALGSRVRRHPKLFTIGEKSTEIVSKLVDAKSFSDSYNVKLFANQLLKTQKFKFLYHGDVLVPVYNDERQYQLAMVVDMSTKSIVDHQSLATVVENSDRPVYIGSSVSNHINRFFNKSVIEFYRLMTDANSDVLLMLELYENDPWVKQLQSNVKGVVYVPSFNDLYVILATGKEMHITVTGTLSIASIKQHIHSTLAPILFDQIKDIPLQSLYADVEKGRFIYTNQAIAGRDKAKIIYIDNDDVTEGLKAHLRSFISMHVRAHLEIDAHARHLAPGVPAKADPHGVQVPPEEAAHREALHPPLAPPRLQLPCRLSAPVPPRRLHRCI
jgi:hypothetical protein